MSVRSKCAGFKGISVWPFCKMCWIADRRDERGGSEALIAEIGVEKRFGRDIYFLVCGLSMGNLFDFRRCTL